MKIFDHRRWQVSDGRRSCVRHSYQSDSGSGPSQKTINNRLGDQNYLTRSTKKNILDIPADEVLSPTSKSSRSDSRTSFGSIFDNAMKDKSMERVSMSGRNYFMSLMSKIILFLRSGHRYKVAGATSLLMTDQCDVPPLLVAPCQCLTPCPTPAVTDSSSQTHQRESILNPVFPLLLPLALSMNKIFTTKIL